MEIFVRRAKRPTTIALALYGVGIITVQTITPLSMLCMLIGGILIMWSAAHSS